MNLKSNCILVGLCVIGGTLAAQNFVNLTFDDPRLTGSLTPLSPDFPDGLQVGRAVDLLPGWTLTGNGQIIDRIIYSPPNVGLTGPVVLDASAPSEEGASMPYRLFFNSSFPDVVDFRLSQTGRIPDGASGLSLQVAGVIMDVVINGETVYRTNPNDSAFPVVDVSRFAGQNVNLAFHPVQNPFVGSSFVFDVGGFTQIPEPSTDALFFVGAVTLALVYNIRQRV